ncbi:MAG TPA: hypothetical protein VJT33_18610 [bacterium]|nr:hypothetical protein [bacterium]
MQSVGGLCAVLAGIAGFLYAAAFLIVARISPEAGRFWSALFLMLGGLLSTGALTALYERLRGTGGEGLSLWALLLGVAGVMGAAIHGGYDMASAVQPTAQTAAPADAPSPVDPRGLLTFAVTGLAFVIFGALISGGGPLPRGLGSLAYVQGALLIILYLGRLTVLVPSSPVIVIPAIVSGFITGPAWYVRLGLALRRPA